MKLSEHFDDSEFADKSTGAIVKIDARLIDGLEQLRARIGRPVLIVSGYRTPAHNAEIGGASHSQHVQGRAADIAVQGMQLLALLEAVFRVPAFAGGGIGLYPKDGHVHVDCRSDGPARWIG